MNALRSRPAASAAAAALLAFAAACGGQIEGSGASDEEAGGAAGSPQDSGAEIEGVQNFYGEWGDYATVSAALTDGEITEDDLEHPWVVQQNHVDAAEDWDGSNPVYELTPPAGGEHLSQWQTCNGAVYPGPIVDGNAVHSLEHGAVWLTYDPELVDEGQIAELASKIQGRDYSLMSAYPGQGVAVSLQSWGNQYQTDDPADAAIDAYLDKYILNEAFNPEAMAICSGGVAVVAE